MNVGWSRLRVELWRKGIHLCTGLVPLLYAVWLERRWAVAWLALFSAVMILVEVLRRGDHALGRLFRRWFAFMLRRREADEGGLLGATPYCLASLACVALLPKPVAVLALLYLAVGDTAASLVGLAWGRHRVGNKSIEGFLGFWGAASLVAIVARVCSPEYALAPALAAALAAALAELLLPPACDDNWSVPLTASAVMLALIAWGF
jgi:dolichol kinase